MALERFLEPRPCPDCGAEIDALHESECDVERCPYCGAQALQCFIPAICPHCQQPFVMTECGETLVESDRIPWSGVWPGVAECVEFGWYAKFSRETGWIKCERDDPAAVPDLNRLHVDARWSRDERRYILA